MEHRCGMRHQVDVEVHVRACQGAVASAGRLTEVSISGGFVKTPLPVHASALVSLRSQAPGVHIEGYVVRREAAGVAIEWLEFAPELVQFLTQSTPRSRSPGYPSLHPR
jgi:hypothetical protein